MERLEPRFMVARRCDSCPSKQRILHLTSCLQAEVPLLPRRLSTIPSAAWFGSRGSIGVSASSAHFIASIRHMPSCAFRMCIHHNFIAKHDGNTRHSVDDLFFDSTMWYEIQVMYCVRTVCAFDLTLEGSDRRDLRAAWATARGAQAAARGALTAARHGHDPGRTRAKVAHSPARSWSNSCVALELKPYMIAMYSI